MRLQAEAGQAALAALLGERDVVDAAADHVRVDVDVEVEGAADELARPVGRGWGRHVAQISDKSSTIWWPQNRIGGSMKICSPGAFGTSIGFNHSARGALAASPAS